MKIRKKNKKNQPKSENFPCPGHSGYFARKWMWAPHGPSLDQLPPMIVKGTMEYGVILMVLDLSGLGLVWPSKNAPPICCKWEGACIQFFVDLHIGPCSSCFLQNSPWIVCNLVFWAQTSSINVGTLAGPS